MEYIRLGQTDLNISRVGFGCAAMSSYYYGTVDDRDSVAAVRRALDLGINFFDTADVYGLGHAEEVLGKALDGRTGESLVATKFGVAWDEQGKTYRDISPSRVVEALHGSLRRLKLDCIPLYQIHWPDGKTPILETLDALKKCQESGKIQHIGCCNFPLELIVEAAGCCRFESVQLPYSLAERESQSVFQHGEQQYGTSALAYNVLAQGLFTGKYGPESTFNGTDLRQRSQLFQGANFHVNLALLEKLKLVGSRHGRTPTQVAIRWTLSQPSISCAIVGIKRPEQAEENCRSVGWSLSPDDLKYLNTSSID